MSSSQTQTLTLLALLVVASMAGTVQLGSGTNVTVADPLTKSLSSSYSLGGPFPYTWNRMRTGSYNKFAEYYELSSQSACQIKCGPFSWPVISGNLLYCERDLSYFSKNQPFYTTVAYKALCIPEVSIGTGNCALATYGIFAYTGGSCSQSSSSIHGHPAYGANSANYDCCHNNANAGQNNNVNEFSDHSAIIL